MRPTLAWVCVLALASFSAAEDSGDPAAAAAIRRADDTLARADAAGDASAAIDAYADDVLLMPSGEEPVRGKAAVRRWWDRRTASAPRTVREQYETASLDVCGDFAIESGSIAAEQEIEGTTRTHRTPRLAVWRRQPDGAWKIEKEAFGGSAAAVAAAPASAPAVPAPPPVAAPAPEVPDPTRLAPPTDVVPIPDPRGLSDGFVRTVGDRLRMRAAKIRSLQEKGGEPLRAAISRADHELQATIRDVGWIDVARFGVAVSCDAAFIVTVSGDPALVRSAVPWMKDLQTNPDGAACYQPALEAYRKLPPR
jgi:ketosteroid isomerase-like protein